MKKVLFLAVLAVVVALAVTPVVAVANGGDNFQKAGQKVLREKERLLMEQEAAIRWLIGEVVRDRVVTGDEMIALNKEIDYFGQLKISADKELEFYGLITTTELEEEMVRVVKGYYKITRFHRSDALGLVRLWFVNLVGEDVEVEKSGIEIAGGQIILIVCLLVLLFLGLWFYRDGSRKTTGVCWLCWFLFLFFGVIIVLI